MMGKPGIGLLTKGFGLAAVFLLIMQNAVVRLSKTVGVRKNLMKV